MFLRTGNVRRCTCTVLEWRLLRLIVHHKFASKKLVGMTTERVPLVATNDGLSDWSVLRGLTRFKQIRDDSITAYGRFSSAVKTVIGNLSGEHLNNGLSSVGM